MKKYLPRLDNLDKMEKFLETHKLSKLTQEEIETLNRPIRNKEIESIIKNFPTKKHPDQLASLVNSIHR